MGSGGTLPSRTMPVLVLNAGSSSLKSAVFDRDLRKAAAASTSAVSDMRGAVADVISNLAKQSSMVNIEAVGHRVVHGGSELQSSVIIDDKVKGAIRRACELAPLHNPPALEAIEAAQAALPHAQHVAVFDTSFFATLPPKAYIYPVPYEWFERWGIRRFGFHGISHQYCAQRAAELLARTDLRLVICHLGNGCSASAVQNGSAVATTMGFTPMEGLMMGSRSGSIDPGILLWVQRQQEVTAEKLDEILNHHSGLLGVSGVSSDYRKVASTAAEGNARAQLALDIYADRVRSTIGGLAATLGGLDAVVFTGGVGENRPELRARACSGLEFMGLALDQTRNEDCKHDSDIAAANASVRVLVIHTDEELMIARVTAELLR